MGKSRGKGLLDHLAGLLGGSTDEGRTDDSADSSGAAPARDERSAALADRLGLSDAAVLLDGA